MPDEQRAQRITTEEDAEKLWNGSSIVREEFSTPGTLWHFAQAIRSGQARILRK